MAEKITGTLRALQVLRDNSVMSPRQFGHLLWPENPGWHRMSNKGIKGAGLNLAAGALLGKLRQKSLISNNYPVIVRDAALKLLDDAGL